MSPAVETSNFDLAAEQLEVFSSLNRLEARGTLRIALKDSGFSAKSVAPDQLRVVIEKLLPEHLRDRGVSEPEEICQRLVNFLPNESLSANAETPEAIFARLGSH